MARKKNKTKKEMTENDSLLQRDNHLECFEHAYLISILPQNWS